MTAAAVQRRGVAVSATPPRHREPCPVCKRPLNINPSLLYCWADRSHTVEHVCTAAECRIRCRDCSFSALLTRATGGDEEAVA